MGENSVRVLLVEDDLDYVPVVVGALARARETTYVLTHVDNLESSLEILREQTFDLVLLDLSLPGSKGLDTLRTLRGTGQAVPTIVLTCDENEAQAIQAVQEGAEDYLFKAGLDHHLLSRCVRYAVERHRRMREEALRVDALASCVRQLAAGLAHLASGDFSARVGEPHQSLAGCPEMRELFADFDRTAQELEFLRRMQTEFYGAVAHDLRAPLSTITLALRNLESSEGKPEMHAKYLEIVNRRTGRMFALIDSLLDYFSLQNGKARLDLASCDVNQVLEEICEDAAAEAHNRGQKIEVQPLPGDATAIVDKTKLSRVLENLLTNAMKYSGSHTVIRIGARELDGGTLRFDVSDQGPGINAQEQPVIFDPFVRGRNGGEGTGRGLGLAICKSFVSAHGGEIWVESSPGQGSCFSFRIPRLAAHLPGHPPEGAQLRVD